MKIEIITPDEKIFSGEAKLVQVPGEISPFTILENHAPIISTLEKGKIRIVSPQNKTSFVEINGGVIEVQNNNILILAEAI